MDKGWGGKRARNVDMWYRLADGSGGGEMRNLVAAPWSLKQQTCGTPQHFHSFNVIFWFQCLYLHKGEILTWLTYLLTELSPSWEAANCAATQELPSIS
jgi:hypothetical protein